MAFKATIPDFSGLFNPLNEAINTYKERESVSKTLGDLDVSTVEGLESAATRLAKAGRLQDAMKFQTAAQSRRELNRRTAADAASQQFLSNPAMMDRLLGKKPAGTEGDDGTTFSPFGGAPAAPGRLPWPGDRQSAVPTQGPQLAEALLGASGAQAQGGPVLPEWAQQGMLPGVGPAGPTIPRQRGPAPTIPGEKEAEARIQELARGMATLGPKMTPQKQALQVLINEEIGKTKWSPDIKRWQMERIDRHARGEPDIGLSEFGAWEKRLPEMHKEVSEFAAKQYDKRDTAENTLGTIQLMREVHKNPDFIAGPLAPGWANLVSGLGSVKDLLVSFGVSEKNLPDLTKPMNQAALIQTYNALGNRLVFETLQGKLGTAVSNTDREFTAAMFPILRQTKEGQALLHEVSAAFAGRAKQSGDVTEQYMLERGMKANRAGLEKTLRELGEGNTMLVSRDGKFTPLGQKIQDFVSGTRTPGAAPQAPAPAAAPPAAAPTQGIVPPVPTGGPPTLRDIGQGLVRGREQTGAGPPARLSAPAGAIVRDGQGRRYRIGSDGTPVPLGPEVAD